MVVLLVVRSGDTKSAGANSYSNLEPTAGFEPATRYLQIRIYGVRGVSISADECRSHSAAKNFVPTSTDKYRLVANRLVVFWWYGFHLKLAPSRLVHLFIGAPP